MAKKQQKTMRAADLTPAPYNPRKITDRALESLKKAMRQFGDLSGIVFNWRTGRLVGGHQRLKILDPSWQIEKHAHADKVGTVAVGHIDTPFGRWQYREVDWPEKKEMAANVAANKHGGEWDIPALKDILVSLDDGEFDLDITGFDEIELKELIDYDGRPDDNLMSITSDLGGALALKIDMAFPSKEIYGIPELREDMLSGMPEPVSTWSGKNTSPESEYYFYNFGSDSIDGLNLRKTVIGFYTDDHKFEQAWEKPDEFTGKLINRKPLAVLSPNYSLWYGMPKAVHIWNTYRSRWVGRYFQEAGLKLIPDVNFCDDDSFGFCLAGIPKNAPCIAFQWQTKTKDPEELSRRKRGIKKAVDFILPDSLFIYGGDHAAEELEGLFPSSLKVILVCNRILQRRKRMDDANVLK